MKDSETFSYCMLLQNLTDIYIHKVVYDIYMYMTLTEYVRDLIHQSLHMSCH